MADERHTDEPKREGEILGLGDIPVSSGADDEVRAIAKETQATAEETPRRRRSDDIAEREAAPRDPIGGPDAPPGLHVED
jgi:hypothetical protein